MDGVPEWVFALFAAATAFGVLLQAAILLVIGIAARVALKRAEEFSKLAQEHALPILASTRTLLDDVSPKLKVAAQNVQDVSEKLKTESGHVTTTVDDLLKKAESQADRVDEMLTGTLNTVAHATATLQKAVTIPVRQVGAVLTGLRVGFDVLRSKEREGHVTVDGGNGL